jgi:ComF family protein
VSIASPFCSKCGLPFVSREGDDHTCSECLSEKRYFGIARASGVYEGTLMEALHRFKYTKKTALSKPLSFLAAQTFSRFWDGHGIGLVVPVPLQIRRLRERGFNQAVLLAKGVGRLGDMPVDPFVLVRTRWTEPQTSLSRKERKKNLKGAFAVRKPENVRGKKVLLVDDVYTTGSTVNECSRVLLRAGAHSVDVLTVARAV